MKRTRVAVVGCGHLGTIHARLLAARADAELVAVVDPDASARERVAATHGCRAVAEPPALVGLADAVVVAAPTPLHAAVGIPLLEAGIDLLVEKPIAAAVEDARALVIAARRQSRVVAVGHVERFNPAWQAAVDRAGRPFTVVAERCAPFTFRSLDVGVVHDLMIHDIDLVLSLEPGRLERIEARGLKATGGFEDLVRARLTFSSGLVAELVASRISPVLSRRVTLWSPTAIVTADLQSKTLEVVAPSPEVAAGAYVAARVPPADRAAARERFFADVLPRTTVQVDDANAIEREHDDFLAAVRTRAMPRVTAAAGAAAVEIAALVIDELACVRFGAPEPVQPTLPATIPLLPRRKTG